VALHSADQIVSGLACESGAIVNWAGAQQMLRVQTKTADYTVTLADSGTYFTTHGDTGAIVFTLPVTPTKGAYYYFFQSVDQNLSVNAGVADTMKAFNDLDADGITLVTGSNLIGGLFFVFGDGYFWNAVNLSKNTLTVTT
jgi:hypothetical protein